MVGPAVGEFAFSGCYGLISVIIADSVTSIGSSAFYSCGSITSLVIGNSVTGIGNRAFFALESLISVTIPNSVNYIDDFAFGGCYGLTSITIPSSVNYIGVFAFEACGSLSSVTIIGNSGTIIGYNGWGAFISCQNVRNAYLGCDLPDYNTIDLFPESRNVNVVRLSCAPTSGKMYSYCSNRLLNSYPTVNICSVIGRL